MPRRFAPVSGPHSVPQDRTGQKTTAGRARRSQKSQRQPKAGTGNKGRGSAQGRPGARARDRRSGPHNASTGGREPPGVGIEWARGARRSPCTRRAADQERPRQRDRPKADQEARQSQGQKKRKAERPGRWPRQGRRPAFSPTVPQRCCTGSAKAFPCLTGLRPPFGQMVRQDRLTPLRTLPASGQGTPCREPRQPTPEPPAPGRKAMG